MHNDRLDNSHVLLFHQLGMGKTISQAFLDDEGKSIPEPAHVSDIPRHHHLPASSNLVYVRRRVRVRVRACNTAHSGTNNTRCNTHR